MRDKSDSEKIRVYIDWSNKNRLEEAILRLSSETKGGWSSNYYLDFTTSRIIITKKNILTKFADLGYVAGLGPYPYLVLMKDFNSSKIRKQASITPDDLVKSENFSDFIWYSNIEGLLLRKGIDTVVANMFGRAIVSNFLSIKTTVGKTYDFTLPVNKNGSYEQILFWLSVSLPPNCRPLEDTKL
ncbi:MAG: hypothetical protein ACRD5H_00335 [Nitrososphaerales archaeon]